MVVEVPINAFTALGSQSQLFGPGAPAGPGFSAQTALAQQLYQQATQPPPTAQTPPVYDPDSPDMEQTMSSYQDNTMLGALLGEARSMGNPMFVARPGSVERNVVELGQRQAVARADMSFQDGERMRRARNMAGNMTFREGKQGARLSREYDQLVRQIAGQLA